MSDELRKLAEDAKEMDGWYPASVMWDVLSAVKILTAKEDAAFIAAASPDVVLGLLDRIDELEEANRACVDAVAEWGAKSGALQAEVDRLRDLFKAENDVHRQHTRGLNQRLDMERDTILDIAAGFKSERDEAREAVIRLAGIVRTKADEARSSSRPHESDLLLSYIADPVVRRVVEGVRCCRVPLISPVTA
jgi:hypothetical protein